MVVDALQDGDRARAVEHLGRRQLGWPSRRSEHAAIEVEADHLGHDLGRGAIERSPYPGQVVTEFGEAAVGAQKGVRGNREAIMRWATSTPSAITSPLPVGRSGRRSTLLRSRKSSTRGSAGSVMSITSDAAKSLVAHASSSTSTVIRSAACSRMSRSCGPRVASRSCSQSWLARRSRSTNSAPEADTATRIWRPSAGCAARTTSPGRPAMPRLGSWTADGHVPARPAHRGHRALLGQRRQCGQLGEGDR